MAKTYEDLGQSYQRLTHREVPPRFIGFFEAVESVMMGVGDVGCLNKIGISNRKVVVSACYWKKIVRLYESHGLFPLALPRTLRCMDAAEILHDRINFLR